MKTIERDIVGAFIISIDNFVLLGKNKKGGTYEGMWTIPGGGKEPGENTFEAVKRELLEEVGLDISGANLEPLELKTGESQKTIDGERMLVKMTFTDYIIRMPKAASDITTQAGGDFAEAKWIPIAELGNLSVAPLTLMTLKKIIKEL
jgi:8-oxo-dGTP pyrophosphatase MutT (NUDIX family)